MIQFDPDKFYQFFKKTGYTEHVQHFVREGWVGAVRSLEQTRDELVTSLFRRNGELSAMLDKTRAEVAHWKGNHDHQVKMARTLRERDDLPVERLRFYDDVTAAFEENKRLKEQLANSIRECRDMFMVDSVSWKLLNDRLEAIEDEQVDS